MAPKKLAVLVQCLAHTCAFGLFKRAGANVGFDAHLFAGHGVQREPGCDLGHPFGAFGHDHKLHDGDDQKDDQTDHDATANHKFAKGFDDLARVRFGQDQAGCRNRK